jgi:hypothetical protein
MIFCQRANSCACAVDHAGSMTQLLLSSMLIHALFSLCLLQILILRKGELSLLGKHIKNAVLNLFAYIRAQ